MATYTLADLQRVREARTRPERTITEKDRTLTLKSDAELRQIEADILSSGVVLVPDEAEVIPLRRRSVFRRVIIGKDLLADVRERLASARLGRDHFRLRGHPRQPPAGQLDHQLAQHQLAALRGGCQAT